MGKPIWETEFFQTGCLGPMLLIILMFLGLVAVGGAINLLLRFPVLIVLVIVAFLGLMAYIVEED